MPSTVEVQKLQPNFFIGLDGNFSIKNNIIERDLSILKIKSGKAILAD